MDNNTNDAVASRRRALAEALRTGEPVVVTASGEVEKKEDAQDQGLSGIHISIRGITNGLLLVSK